MVAAIAGGANIDEEGLEIAFEPTYEVRDSHQVLLIVTCVFMVVAK